VNAAAPPILGVSFSHRRAADLGLDPATAFERLLQQTGVRHLRLPLYWPEIAPEPSRIDFTSVRPWLDMAARHSARVVMTLGLKAPGTPGYYPPPWLIAQHPLPPGANLDQHPRVLAFLTLMLERATAYLADFDVIEAWQVEHLPFAPTAAGGTGWRISTGLLAREIAVVQEADPRRRPVVVNHRGTGAFDRWWLPALQLADVLGQSMAGHGPRRWWDLRHRAPFGPALRRQAAVARRLGKDLWITELSAEPSDAPETPGAWSPIGAIPSPDHIRADVEQAARTGASRVYLTGAEWWLSLAQHHGDRHYLELMRDLLAGSG
jgi:hypothetical protein